MENKLAGKGRSASEAFNGVKVFSATKAQDREQIGERITDWVRQHPERKVLDVVVTQSSDEAFHCLAITVFYREESAAA